jgi:endonuclease/exonuclease/phosphatase family metal-dependent hydrolase
VVLGGDLNAHPGRDAHAALTAAGLHDVDPGGPPTYPAGSPSARIDHVFVTEGVRASDARTATTTASDHLPVVVRLELPA